LKEIIFHLKNVILIIKICSYIFYYLSAVRESDSGMKVSEVRRISSVRA